MHSATANDYMPNGPLLLVCTLLLLDALPRLVYQSLLKIIPSKTGTAGDLSLPQGDAFALQPALEQRALLPGRKDMGEGRERERGWTTHGWEAWWGDVPHSLMPGGLLLRSQAMPGACKMTKAMVTLT